MKIQIEYNNSSTLIDLENGLVRYDDGRPHQYITNLSTPELDVVRIIVPMNIPEELKDTLIKKIIRRASVS